ncbi:V-type proton ATPase 16 kDa proteolipid subunit, partial [Tanacetum coccineum]
TQTMRALTRPSRTLSCRTQRLPSLTAVLDNALTSDAETEPFEAPPSPDYAPTSDADTEPLEDQRYLIMSSTFSGDETAPFFGFLGAAAALVFSCMGAAYGTAKSGVGVASMGVMRPELVMKSIVPVVMAGVLGIYGLIIAVIISTGINPKAKSYYLFDGYAHLSSGLACGLAGLSAGMAIGIVGDAGVRANAQQPKLFVGMILILIFAEALALYGLIVGIILSSRAGQSRAD